jgi:hypothetical protein
MEGRSGVLPTSPYPSGIVSRLCHVAIVAQALRVVPGISATQGFRLYVIDLNGRCHMPLARAVSAERFGVKAALTEFAPVVVVTRCHTHSRAGGNGWCDYKSRCSSGHDLLSGSSFAGLRLPGFHAV